MTVKTGNAVSLSLGGLILLSIAMSKYNKKWLLLGSLAGISLIHSGLSGFSPLAYFLEKADITRPDYGHSEEQKLKNMNKIKVIKKVRKLRREILNYIKEAETKNPSFTN
jgi:hypothetical protein